MNGGIFQLSQSIDLKAAALQARAAGTQLEFGLVRIDLREGPWTIRLRKQMRKPVGPDPFIPNTSIMPDASIVVIEGGERGSQTWEYAPGWVRDFAHTSHARSVDVRVRVLQSPVAEPNLEPVQLVAWAERAVVAENNIGSTINMAADLATVRANIAASTFSHAIPPDCDTIDVNLPSGFFDNSIAAVYPIVLHQLDASGIAVTSDSIAAATPRVTLPLWPGARWVVATSAAGAQLNVVYRRH